MSIASHSMVACGKSNPQQIEQKEVAEVLAGLVHTGTRQSLLDATLDVAIIDARLLMRECFSKSLSIVEPALSLKYFASVEEFGAADPDVIDNVQVMLIYIGWSSLDCDGVQSPIARAIEMNPSMGVIVLSDVEDIGNIQKAIEGGARGYIPTSIGLEVAVKAMQLVGAGGIYIPVSILFASGETVRQKQNASDGQDEADNAFTSRQLAVIEALRRGKANKIIAYELNMCESTVKVHVRNVMRKLNARNRTEVAYILSNRTN